jgi:REP element-mobilizing transposase RayT
MPRNPRINLEGALYYITSRAIEGMNLFNDKEDFHAYLELLARYKNQHGFKLFAYSLMNAHVHLLVELKAETTLSEIMHNITSAYTKYYNKKNNRQGHLFRGRYRATIVEKEPYLLKLTRYMHMNPVRSGLALDPAAYPYSSYLYYTGRAQEIEKQVAMRPEVAEALAFPEGKSYEDYLKENNEEEAKAFHRDLQRRLFIGSEEFGKKVEACMSQARSTGEMEDIEDEEARPRKFVVPIVSGVIVAALAGSLLLVTQRTSRKSQVAAVTQTVEAPLVEKAIPFDIVGLDGSTWQIKFVAGTPFQTVDNLTFKDKKVSSENLELNGYHATNYSMTKEESRVIWETMQTSGAGTASWRGEVEAGRMKGVLSLRQSEKEPQDFSFVSLKYMKAK